MSQLLTVEPVVNLTSVVRHWEGHLAYKVLLQQSP